MQYLQQIKSPDDIKTMNMSELKVLAQEIRETLIQVVSENGGHLAPNLGVVELTLALHMVFHTPEDKIIWGVGHQSYVHKLLTGRQDACNGLRQFGGETLIEAAQNLTIILLARLHQVQLTLHGGGELVDLMHEGADGGRLRSLIVKLIFRDAHFGTLGNDRFLETVKIHDCYLLIFRPR